MIKTRIKHKRDTAANWTAENTILLNGEIAIVDDGNFTKLKIGDGSTAYNSLPFYVSAADLNNATGVVPIANGGTGATTISDAKKNLNIGFPLAAISSSPVYTMFARCPKTVSLGNSSATFILSDTDNFGGNVQSTYLINISGRNNVPSMRVIQLVKGTSLNITFGYYEASDYFYFGFYSSSYRGTSNITLLGNPTLAEVADYGDTGTAPTGWTTISPYKLNDTITSLSVSGKVITYTKVDGTTGTITTQDTNTTKMPNYSGVVSVGNTTRTPSNDVVVHCDMSGARVSGSIKIGSYTFSVSKADSYGRDNHCYRSFYIKAGTSYTTTGLTTVLEIPLV